MDVSGALNIDKRRKRDLIVVQGIAIFNLFANKGKLKVTLCSRDPSFLEHPNTTQNKQADAHCQSQKLKVTMNPH